MCCIFFNSLHSEKPKLFAILAFSECSRVKITGFFLFVNVFNIFSVWMKLKKVLLNTRVKIGQILNSRVGLNETYQIRNEKRKQSYFLCG